MQHNYSPIKNKAFMERKNLNMSPVLFNEDGHTYHLEGHQLQGVTPIIAWLFPETYSGIPQSVLDAAAEHGGMIHKKIELADRLGIVDCDAVRDYMKLREQKGVKTLVNEYLVSHERRIASSIDVVMDNLRWLVDHGIHAVVGTSGFDEAKLAEVRNNLGWKK